MIVDHFLRQKKVSNSVITFDDDRLRAHPKNVRYKLETSVRAPS